jgi:hypothetical protein
MKTMPRALTAGQGQGGARMNVGPNQEPAAIHAVAAEPLDRGFRLLVLREFPAEAEPSAYARIDQTLLRAPERQGRHGLSFATAFRPEIVAWLSDDLGRPTLHDASGRPHRNPRWPHLAWRRADRSWPDGVRTVEWFVEVEFHDAAAWARFRRRWGRRLAGEPATEEA